MIRPLLLAALLAAGPAVAQGLRGGDLAIGRPWTLAVPEGAAAAAGYLAIENLGEAPDRLIAVRSSRAERIEIHEVTVVDGVARMRPLPGGLPVGPGETVMLRPGGRHLMIFAPRGPWRAGDRIPLELEFDRAGVVEVELAAQAPTGASPSVAPHAHP